MAPKGVQILGPIAPLPKAAEILSDEALTFVALLHRSFNGRRKELLKLRQSRQQAIDSGRLPNFLPETAHIRQDDTWKGTY
jgi:malate synthase